MVVTSYRDLKVWQLAVDLAADVYRISGSFPAQQRFGLASQLQRSMTSVPSNIAEGHARSGTREYLRFVAVARGSLAEAETQLILAERLGYVSQQDAGGVLARADVLGRMLRRLGQGRERRLHAGLPSDRIP